MRIKYVDGNIASRTSDLNDGIGKCTLLCDIIQKRHAEICSVVIETNFERRACADVSTILIHCSWTWHKIKNETHKIIYGAMTNTNCRCVKRRRKLVSNGD